MFRLLLTALTLFLCTSLHAQDFAQFKGFKGQVTGTVKYGNDKGWFVVVEMQSVKPLEGDAAAFQSLVGQKVRIRTKWITAGKPDPAVADVIKAMQPGQPFDMTVFNRRGNELELVPDGKIPEIVPTVKKEIPVANVKKYNREDITGAQIDESQAKVILTVDPSKADGNLNLATLQEAFTKAYESLVAGAGVKILIQPGTYREAMPKLDWTKGKAAETLLIIEGVKPGEVIWSGSDLFAPTEWQSLGDDLYAHSWDKAFGNVTLRWGAKLVIGHRAEMVFINGKPLQQVLLEDYSYDNKANPSHTYLGLLKPEEVLTPGTFGVVERKENEKKLYIRLAKGQSLAGAKIEVATRQSLGDITEKDNLVLRNLVITHVAGTLRNFGGQTPLIMKNNDNILIDSCDFVWNNGHAVRTFYGKNWTIKNSRFNYNGYSGLQLAGNDNVIMSDCETSYNNWRGSWGQVYGWFIGGAKLHEGNGHLIKNHRAFGNLALGFWYDVQNHNMFIDGLVSAYNRSCSLFLELSQGPFTVENSILGPSIGPQAAVFSTSVITEMLMKNTIIYTDIKGNYTGGIDDNTGQKLGEQGLVRLQWYIRQDLHANQAIINPGLHRIEDTIMVSNSNFLYVFLENNGTNRSNPNYAKYDYAGKNNVFFGSQPGLEFSFLNKAYKKLKLTLPEWQKIRSEKDAIWLDPKFRDPGKLDFRIPEDSPLKISHPNLPYLDMSGPATEALALLDGFLKFARFGESAAKKE